MSKKYRLNKDMPYVKAGAIYELDSPGGTYICDSETAQFVKGVKWDGLDAPAVENADPGWFEEIKQEQPFQWVWTDALVAEYSLSEQKMTLFEFKRFVQQREQSKQSPHNEWEIESLWVEFARDEPKIVKDRLVIYNFLNGDERYSGYKIHSVRRLSDNTIFSVGDEVVHKTDGYKEKIYKLDCPTNPASKMSFWFHCKLDEPYVKDLRNFNKSTPSPKEERIAGSPDEMLRLCGVIVEGLKKTDMNLYNCIIPAMNHWAELAFNAARERIGGFWNNQITNWQYSSFQHYINHKQ